MQRLGLSQTLSQKLSPQQIQFIKLLQVPTAELDTRIEEELEVNPALEEGKEDEGQEQKEVKESQYIGQGVETSGQWDLTDDGFQLITENRQAKEQDGEGCLQVELTHVRALDMAETEDPLFIIPAKAVKLVVAEDPEDNGQQY